MKRNISGVIILFTCLILCSCGQTNNEMIVVPNSDFKMSQYEITQKEWSDIMGDNPSSFKGNDYPVENVSWYQCIEFCNKKSTKEGLTPCYIIDKTKKDPDNLSEYDQVKWIVTVDTTQNGYRLPTTDEWKLAAAAGKTTPTYTYSGSDEVLQVAWTWKNSGKEILSGNWNWTAIEGNQSQTHPVGKKDSNEIGLYDMSGNVREWCFDWYSGEDYKEGYMRSCMGGGWMGDVTCCKISEPGKFSADGIGSDQGFRICQKD